MELIRWSYQQTLSPTLAKTMTEKSTEKASRKANETRQNRFSEPEGSMETK